MAENGAVTLTNVCDYVAGFGKACVDFTVTGPGDLRAQHTWLKLRHLELHRYSENLPRITYLSLISDRVFTSFPIGRASVALDGCLLRNGEIALHGRDGRVHQRTGGASQWGLLSLPASELASCGKALSGRAIVAPRATEVLRPPRAIVRQFERLFAEASGLAESPRRLIDRPEVARALEQDLLHALINCLIAKEVLNTQNTRRHHAIMARLEKIIGPRINHRLSLRSLCAEIGVPERTLRAICAEFLGVSPMRYILLRRLNMVRSALQRADPSTTSVTEIARSHQFAELGRFAETYRIIFGELPSVTLKNFQRLPNLHGASDAACAPSGRH
jgi:AraC-like DNA-binding protein